MKLKKSLIIFSSISGAIAVILGALSAHALKPLITISQMKSFETANKYHIYHTIMIFVIVLLSDFIGDKYVKIIGRSFIVGIILFSGSIYLLSVSSLLHIESLKPILGPITPLGGLCFIFGWVMLLIGAWRNNGNI